MLHLYYSFFLYLSTSIFCFFFFFFNDTATTEIYTLSLHDALPILRGHGADGRRVHPDGDGARLRSEEHTSELQSRFDLVCRLLLEKKKHNVYLVIDDKEKQIYNLLRYIMRIV